MTVSTGNLDALIGATFSASEFTSLSIQSFTSTPANPVSALTATSTGVTYSAGIVSYKIVGTSNLQGSVSVEIFADNGDGPFDAGTIPFFPIGFTANSILFSLNNATIIGEDLTANQDVTANLAMVAVSPLALGTTVAYQSDATFSAALPCFAAGTRILTARGEVCVEDLLVGDRVCLRSGRCVDVTWLGHRHVDCRRYSKPEEVWPVRVQSGAFGEGVPHRDLWLSPDHAVFVGGGLIPVRYLVNGASIAAEPRDLVSYWHVELPRHDVLLAEGLPCESYLDTGNRSALSNGGRATDVQAA